ncbi:MAG: helix-turn-helix domain-containing protein [Synergistaceae bacterium]|nr:helix-turn-helix domain-containing protein [Synergistaceae bacterium]
MVQLQGDYIDMETAMELTGYSAVNIRLLCRQGKIAGAVKVGRSWLIPKDGLLAYVPGPQGFAAAKAKGASLSIPPSDEASRTLRPSEPKSSLLWRIEETEGRLSLVTPERDDAVAAMARRLGFSWSDGAWRRKRPATDDLAVEVAVRLLAMGLPVRVPRAELVPRVAAADYAPFVSKRILASKDRERFEVVWAREDGDFYDVLRRMPGARWDSPRRRMTVPKDRWAEVEDFADAHGFTLSVPARQMAREAEGAMKAALVVDPKPKEPKAPERKEAGGIDAELLDDD